MKPIQLPLPFMGKLMTCGTCGRNQLSDARFSSGWALIAINNHTTYLCPPCAGFHDPQCDICRKFYDGHSYRNCPWCTKESQ